ncbi:MAG: hypothetical protein IME92_03265 [Proteobacteria bacterium]|nr:hypothetical protein [Pseudomonadota bacterium]
MHIKGHSNNYNTILFAHIDVARNGLIRGYDAQDRIVYGSGQVTKTTQVEQTIKAPVSHFPKPTIKTPKLVFLA